MSSSRYCGLVGEACHIPELAKLKLSLQTNLLTFGQTLGLPETLGLRSADAIFVMSDRATTIEQFTIDAGDLGVGAKGNIAADGKLDLQANLNVSEALAQKLPTFVRDTLASTEGTGRRGIAFNITGRNDRPKTNLMEKMLGGKIGEQIGDIVSGLFGKKENRTNRKRTKRRRSGARKRKRRRRPQAPPVAFQRRLRPLGRQPWESAYPLHR